MTRRLVIDTDTASDDAVALLMAVAGPDVEVDAVTVVAGNVPLAQGVKNALFTLAFCGAAEVPVYAGLDRPLVRRPGTATDVHGEDGMGDAGIVQSVGEPVAEHAVDALVRRSEKLPVSVALGDELRGQLVIDHRVAGRAGASAEVVWEIDEQGWKELLCAACSGD